VAKSRNVRIASNNVRLSSAIRYITPKDVLAGYQHEIQAERDRKLEAARDPRKNRRQRDRPEQRSHNQHEDFHANVSGKV
jgi:hypothetical protein